jgi:hypothetical protein
MGIGMFLLSVTGSRLVVTLKLAAALAFGAKPGQLLECFESFTPAEASAVMKQNAQHAMLEVGPGNNKQWLLFWFLCPELWGGGTTKHKVFVLGGGGDASYCMLFISLRQEGDVVWVPYGHCSVIMAIGDAASCIQAPIISDGLMRALPDGARVATADMLQKFCLENECYPTWMEPAKACLRWLSAAK